MQGLSAQAGVSSYVDIVLVPLGEYHCNEQYPHKFTAAAASGVTFPQATVTAFTFATKRSVMRVPFVAASPGNVTIAGKFSFAVCTGDTCEPRSASLALSIKVE